MRQILLLCIAYSNGLLFNYLNIPAGWIMGSLLIGILYGIVKGEVVFSPVIFKIGLAFVSATIGLRIDTNVIQELAYVIVPFSLVIIIALFIGTLLSSYLIKRSTIDPLTSFFSCIPGGASEVIGLSKDYGADDRIVAAIHTLRITMFVIIIPFVIKLINPNLTNENLVVSSFEFNQVSFYLIVVLFVILLDRIYHLPGGTLLYGLVISFLLSNLFPSVMLPPNSFVGVGPVIIGLLVGVRFNREVLTQLFTVGHTIVFIMLAFIITAFVNAYLFSLVTRLDYSTSLLGTVPAGAAEMAATAFSLDISATLIASMHVYRVVFLFIILPFFIKYSKGKWEKNGK